VITAIDLAASRAFLDSPAATRIAAGRAANSNLAVVSGFSSPSGRPCRIIEQTVQLGDDTVRALGKMCELPNGQWGLMP
jgi:hypothetical protein